MMALNSRRVLRSRTRSFYWTACLASAVGVAAAPTGGVRAEMIEHGGVTTITVPKSEAARGLDLSHATPKPLPQAGYSAAQIRAGLAQAALVSPEAQSAAAGTVPGAVGDGKQHPVLFGPPRKSFASTPKSAESGAVVPQSYGTNGSPFTTVRADLYTSPTNTEYPYRATGFLVYNDGTKNTWCTGSLIKSGVVVTAAQCIAKFGSSKAYTGFQFIPAARNGVAPYGTWTTVEYVVPSAYLNGTDSCAQSGTVCADDVGLLILNPQGGNYPGKNTGFYGYAYGGAGFAGTHAEVTELGYPGNLDNSNFMERNDAVGTTISTASNNTEFGSLMGIGSSGSPLIVNFGVAPTLTGGASAGSYSTRNIVVGVTSWGLANDAVKLQGASPFTSGNINTLVTTACNDVPNACK